MTAEEEKENELPPSNNETTAESDRTLFNTLISKEPETITQEDLNAILAAADLTTEDIASLDALAREGTSETITSDNTGATDLSEKIITHTETEEAAPYLEHTERTLEMLQEDVLRADVMLDSNITSPIDNDIEASATKTKTENAPEASAEAGIALKESSSSRSFLKKLLNSLALFNSNKNMDAQAEPAAAVLTFDFTTAEAPISKKQKKEEEDAAAALSMAKAEDFIQERENEKKETKRFKNPLLWLISFLLIALTLSGVGWYWIIYKKHNLLAELLDESAALVPPEPAEEMIHYRWIGEKIMYPLFTSTAPGAEIIPRIFLIVYDVGMNEDLTDAVYDSLPLETILAFSPYAPEHLQQIEQAKAEGFSTVAMIPLETAENVDFGRLTVFSGPSGEQTLNDLLVSDPQNVILLGGDVLLASTDDTQKLIDRLKGRQIIAPPDCLMTQWHAVARQKKVDYWPITHMVYAHQLDVLGDILEDAEKMATQIGRAIIAVPLRKNMLDHINNWIYSENMSIIGLSSINLL